MRSILRGQVATRDEANFLKTFSIFSTHTISVQAWPDSSLFLSLHRKGQRSKEPARLVLLLPQLAVTQSSTESTREKNLAWFSLMLFCSCKVAVVQQRQHSKNLRHHTAFLLQLITWEMSEPAWDLCASVYNSSSLKKTFPERQAVFAVTVSKN